MGPAAGLVAALAHAFIFFAHCSGVFAAEGKAISFSSSARDGSPPQSLDEVCDIRGEAGIDCHTCVSKGCEWCRRASNYEEKFCGFATKCSSWEGTWGSIRDVRECPPAPISPPKMDEVLPQCKIYESGKDCYECVTSPGCQWCAKTSSGKEGFCAAAVSCEGSSAPVKSGDVGSCFRKKQASSSQDRETNIMEENLRTLEARMSKLKAARENSKSEAPTDTPVGEQPSSGSTLPSVESGGQPVDLPHCGPDEAPPFTTSPQPGNDASGRPRSNHPNSAPVTDDPERRAALDKIVSQAQSQQLRGVDILPAPIPNQIRHPTPGTGLSSQNRD